MDYKLYTDGVRLSLDIADVIRENPQTSFPLGEYPEVSGYIRYAPTAKPVATPEQNIVEEMPTFINGEYHQSWSILPATTQEIAQRLIDRKIQMKADAADIRWKRETGGITFNGIPVSTDSESQTKLISVFVLASQNPSFSVTWKGTDGKFYPLSSTQIIDMVGAVRQHIQDAFNWEAQVVAEIDSATTHSQLDSVQLLS